LTDPSPVELLLDLLDGKREPGRDTLDDDTKCRAVGLTPRRDPEDLAETTRHRR
jgi:hypothetical protein